MRRQSITNVAIFLFVCIFTNIFSFGSISAHDYVSDNFVDINVLCDETIDLSGIIITIYETTLSDYDVETDTYQFDKYYYSSVNLDRNGNVKIVRPFEYFSISVDLKTLPDSFGINECSYFFQPSDTTFTTYIDKIQAVDVEFDNGEWSPLLYNEEGSSLYTLDVKLEEDIYPMFYYDNTDLNEIFFRKFFSVNVADNSFDVVKEDIYEYEDIADKSTFLYNYELIGEKEHVENIAEYFLLTNDDDNVSLKTDGTCLYFTLKNYYDLHNDKDFSPVVEEALDSFEVQSASASSYVTEGRFRVYYDSTIVSSSVARKVAEEFDTADSVFCGIVGLKTPQSSNSYYKVTLTDMSANGVTTHIGGYKSEIQISYSTARYFSNVRDFLVVNRDNLTTVVPDNAFAGVIAHEYFHAIMIAYGILPSTTNDDVLWMHESFASAIGCIYEDDYAYLKAGQVRTFLSKSWLSLNDYSSDQNRAYGSLLFPLYINNMMGGYSTFKSILNSYSGDPFSAISNGLTAKGYTLENAVAGCCAFNSNADYFYHGSSSPDYYWTRGYITTFNAMSVNTNSASVLPLACHYNDFHVGGTPPVTLTLVINIDYSLTQGASAALRTVTLSSGGSYTVQNRTLNSSGTIIMVRGIGNATRRVMFVPINCGFSGAFTYTRTVSVSYA